MGSLNMERRWVYPTVLSSLVCLFLLATSFNTINTLFSILPSRVAPNQTNPNFADTKAGQIPSRPTGPTIPRFAYLISGSKGDLEKLWRTLKALYHPLNHYVLHLDLESPPQERLELASRVAKDHVFVTVGNVYMITKANMVTYRGPTMVANTLHACAILIKQNKEWDWFINLSASDYPLVTQDDLIYTFKDLSRDLNFIEHTSKLDWKEGQRAMPLIVDPGLYLSEKSDIFPVNPKRSLPTAFKLFTGSAWMILSRAFVEYLIMGWDNLPRTLLMYYTNFVSSPEGYFHTVICNVQEFIPTTMNHDMHYISWDTPPKQHPHVLTLNDTSKMVESNAAFARKFKLNDPVLDWIDKELLNRKNGSFTPGGWCAGSSSCSKVGDPRKLKPGKGSQRLRKLIERLILTTQLGQQCK
ncbi:unnamed protein product [Rhodiola kirilowii]